MKFASNCIELTYNSIHCTAHNTHEDLCQNKPNNKSKAITYLTMELVRKNEKWTIGRWFIEENTHKKPIVCETPMLKVRHNNAEINPTINPTPILIIERQESTRLSVMIAVHPCVIVPKVNSIYD